MTGRNPGFSSKYIFLFFFLFLPVYAGASYATSTRDSIRNLLDAAYHFSKKNPDSSLWAVITAIDLAKGIQNDTLLADCYLEMSFIESGKSNPSASIANAYKAINLYEALNLYNGMAKGFCRVAWNKLEAGNHDNVLDDLYIALELAKRDVDSTVLSTVYHMLGAAYNWVNKYGGRLNEPAYRDSFEMWMDSSIFYNQKTVEIRRRINARGLPNSLNNLGMVLLKKATHTNSDYDAVDRVHQEVLAMRHAQEDYRGMASTYTNLSQLERHRGNYKQALDYAHKARKIGDTLDYPFQVRLNYNELAHIHEVLGNFDSALLYTRRFHNMELEAVSEKHKNAAKEMETQYAVSKKDETLLLQEHKLKVRQIYLIITLIVLVIFCIIMILLYRLYIQNKNLSLRNSLLIKEQNHRVKNNLQIISGLLSLQANRLESPSSRQAIEASQSRIDAMSLIQKRLYGNDMVNIQMDDLLDELTRQVLILAGIKVDNLKKDFAPLKLKAEKATAVGLIVNELLTNACKYAFPGGTNNSLSISLLETADNKLILQYHDNGPGFDINIEQNKKESFGLKLIHIQVLQLSGHYHWQKNGGMSFKAIFPQ